MRCGKPRHRQAGRGIRSRAAAGRLAELGARQSRSAAHRDARGRAPGARRRDAAHDAAWYADMYYGDEIGLEDVRSRRSAYRIRGRRMSRGWDLDAIRTELRCNGRRSAIPASASASRGCRSARLRQTQRREVARGTAFHSHALPPTDCATARAPRAQRRGLCAGSGRGRRLLVRAPVRRRPAIVALNFGHEPGTVHLPNNSRLLLSTHLDRRTNPSERNWSSEAMRASSSRRDVIPDAKCRQAGQACLRCDRESRSIQQSSGFLCVPGTTRGFKPPPSPAPEKRALMHRRCGDNTALRDQPGDKPRRRHIESED